MMMTMTYDPELKELTRLGRRLERIDKERAALMVEIEAEVRRAKEASISDERIAGELKISRLTVAKLKGGTTPRKAKTND